MIKKLIKSDQINFGLVQYILDVIYIDLILMISETK